MKKIGWGVLLVIALLIIGILYTMSSTGFFRSIDGSFDDRLIQKIGVEGAEDLVISRSEEFLIISSDNRMAHRDGKEAICGLYKMSLSDNQLEFLDVEMPHELHPHGIDMIELDSGIYRLLVVNHVYGQSFSLADININHYIEEFRLEYGVLKYIKSHESDKIKSPNDVVAIDATKFYLTNDHGSDTKRGLMGEDYLGWRRSGVVYYDGNSFTDVASGIAYANGIMADQQRGLMYVASPRDFLIKVYQIGDGGSLSFIEDVDCGTGVDNLTLDNDGSIWVGCHPSLLTFTAYASGGRDKSPSELIKIEYRDKGDYEVTSLAIDDGHSMSAATVAIPYQNKVYMGNVMDHHMVVLKAN